MDIKETNSKDNRRSIRGHVVNRRRRSYSIRPNFCIVSPVMYLCRWTCYNFVLALSKCRNELASNNKIDRTAQERKVMQFSLYVMDYYPIREGRILFD